MQAHEIRTQLLQAARVGGESFVTAWGNAVHWIASETVHSGDVAGAQELRQTMQYLPLQKETEDALCVLTGQVEPAVRRGKNGAKIFCYRRLHKGTVDNAVFNLEQAQAYLSDWRTEYKNRRSAGYSRGKLLLEQVRLMLPARKEERKVNAASIAASIERLRKLVPDCPQAQQASIGRILSEAIESLERL